MIKRKQILFFLLFIGLSFNLVAQNTDEQLANEYYSSKEYDKAVIYYEKLFNKTDNKSFYNRLLVCFIELNEFKNGEKLIKRQIKTITYRYLPVPLLFDSGFGSLGAPTVSSDQSSLLQFRL